jgi:predicted house-cleaning noncanonical NTP pyrophosphatase (MazG superfamily)
MIETHNKLVRDRIPEIIRTKGHIPKIKVLDGNDFFTALNHKLMEEVAEYLENHDIEELADILEVILALIKCHGFSHEKFEQLRLRKRKERGGYCSKIFLINIERHCSQVK